MFGFFKRKEQKIIAEQEKTIGVLKEALNASQEERRFAEKCSEESLEKHVLDLEKIKEVLDSKEQWKRKELETNAYVEVALNKLKGEKD